jgi:predicted pyridoxine 5'-phosphate oxidase superfamily flavin-nucleotide-binding protein
MSDQPFHEGEIAVQERAGERDLARRRGAGIGAQIVEGALPFLERQRLLAITAAGDDGFLWTSVWCGAPGFVTSADGRGVSIRPALMSVSAADPVLRRLAVGRDVGMLAIEVTSRRRLRINGTVVMMSRDDIRIVVRESVGNCPKYIQRRVPRTVTAPAALPERGTSGQTLDEERRELVERVDTAFVGSVHAPRGADASHRGGKPGFIHVVNGTTLRVPDYPGNGMFMTLGNFESDPRASLVAVDFEHGRAVSFSGAAHLRYDVEHPNQPTGGTGRYWELDVREWVQFDLPPDIRWELIDPSPFNP